MLVHTNHSRRANSWEDCDAQQSSCSGVGGANRWIAVELVGQMTDISAHLFASQNKEIR